MKKWLPYVVAAVLGIGVAVVAFGPGSGKKEKPAAEEPKADKKKVRTAVDMGADGFDLVRAEGETKTPAEVVADAKANPIPPPGTPRPFTEAATAHKARPPRPFNPGDKEVFHAVFVGGANMPARTRVLTAPTRRARSVSVVHAVTARALCGKVTLAPKPPSAANAASSASNCSAVASIAVYSSAMASCWPNGAWIRGDSECATGWPITA